MAARDLERKAIAAAKAGDWDALSYLYSRYADDVMSVRPEHRSRPP